MPTKPLLFRKKSTESTIGDMVPPVPSGYAPAFKSFPSAAAGHTVRLSLR